MKILGTEIKRGESVTLNLDVAKLHTRSSVQIPVIIERAKEPGPVVLFMGGIHGDEMNGVEIVRRIIRAGINKPTSGTVICIPVFNVFGFLNLSRYFPDGRDLNRVFPGSPTGSLASQFANQLMTKIAPVVNYVVDYHSGAADRNNFAQTRCLFSNEKALELAKAFQAPFIVQSKYIPKSIRDAMNKKGITGLLFEGGKAKRFDEEAIQYGVKGALNVLHFLKMKEVESTGNSQNKIVLVKSSKWLRAPYSGMFHVKTENGGWVKKKSVIGIITDPYGEFENKVRAPFDCYVFCINTSTIVNRGDALFHVSVELA